LAGVVSVAQADGDQFGALLLKILLVLAQLRGVLTAENSTVVSKENHNRRPGSPERSQSNRLPVNVGQRESS
jgi:hypothetical protein